jgi:Protein of unknown function (DUF732)
MMSATAPTAIAQLGNAAAPRYDAQVMKPKFAATVGSLIVSGGVVAAGAGLAAPAQADTTTDTFLNALTTNGLSNVAPGNAVELGQSVCPMLADSGQTTADVASKVADMGGMSLGPATMFTGLAISVFCPGAIARLSDPATISNFVNGQSPIPLSILGR